MLFRSHETTLELAEAGRPWSFDAPAAEFKVGLEAYRISLAHLFDPMMAVHTSDVCRRAEAAGYITVNEVLAA